MLYVILKCFVECFEIELVLDFSSLVILNYFLNGGGFVCLFK